MRATLVRRAARWAYQPLKVARSAVVWSSYEGRIRQAIRRFSGAPFAGLQVGSGGHYKTGWINTDIPESGHKIDMPLDITRPMPFPDDYFSVIYGSEVIEHVTTEEANAFLREAFRTLRPQGVLRITTPDVEALCQIYLGSHPKVDLALYKRFWLGGAFSRDIYINAAFRNYGHQFIYSFESINEMLKNAGFSDIQRTEAQKTNSPYPQLAGIEQHYGTDSPVEIYSSAMIVEATKRR